MKLEHIGIAVEDPEAVAALYEKLLGAAPYKTETVGGEHVRTHFIHAGTAKLELVEALSDEAAVTRFLEKRGEGVHHLAFEVEDIDRMMERVRRLGFTPLSDAPIPGADGKRVFFLHPKETRGVLIEFCRQTNAPLPVTRVPYRGGHLAVYEQGAPGAPVLVVLHGAAGATMRETAPLIRRLAPHFRILALDLTGHGASDDVEEPFSADLFADNVRAALDHFGLRQAHLFGFSMGGYVALHVAHQHPERIRRLAVHGTCTAWTEALVEAMSTRLNAGARADRQRLFERTAAFVRTLPAHSEASEAMLRRIDAPTLVSAVDRDDLFPLSAALHLHRELPEARLALVPGTRHALPAADLDLLAPLLRKHFCNEQ